MAKHLVLVQKIRVQIVARERGTKGRISLGAERWLISILEECSIHSRPTATKPSSSSGQDLTFSPSRGDFDYLRGYDATLVAQSRTAFP